MAEVGQHHVQTALPREINVHVVELMFSTTLPSNTSLNIASFGQHDAQAVLPALKTPYSL
jgi:hypothetical protein